MEVVSLIMISSRPSLRVDNYFQRLQACLPQTSLDRYIILNVIIGSTITITKTLFSKPNTTLVNETITILKV